MLFFKRALTVFGLAAGVVMSSAEAGTAYTWSGATEANAPTNAYVWADADNWGGTDYPRTATDTAKLTGSAARYLMLPDALTVKEIRSGTGTTRFLGKNVTLVDTLAYSTYNGVTGYLFADKVTVTGSSLGVSTSVIAADIDLGTGGQLTAMGDLCGLRFDLYANSDSNVRSNAIVNFKTLTQGTGGPSFCAPNGTAAKTMNFNQTAGSPYLKRTSANASLSVGTHVTGAGIPDGTWLKRNFEDGWIELSQAVTNTLAANTLTFAAFSPVTYQHLNVYYPNGACKSLMQTKKNRAEDSAILEIDKFATNGSLQGFYTEAYLKPWRIILHDVNYNAGNPLIKLGTCDLEFAERSDGKTPGMPQHNVFLYAQDYTDKQAVFTVTNGISASILSLSNIVIKVVKQGAGTLSTRLTADSATANTGSLVVEEGTFEILGTTDGSTAYVKSLTVKAGATLKLGATLRTDSFTAEAGAIVAGPGALELTDLSALPSGVIFRDGASVKVSCAGGALLKERPIGVTKAELGDPAFWFATDSYLADMEYDVVGTVTNVTRWYDCRGHDAKYNSLVTNNTPPVLRKNIPYGTSTINNCLRAPAVFMQHQSTLAQSCGMLMAREISGIRAVFAVRCNLAGEGTGAGGGVLLGWWGDGRGDFARYGAKLYDSSAAANVLNGEHYVNGVRATTSYSLGVNSDFMNNSTVAASLLETYPAGSGARSNAMGYSGKDPVYCGGQYLFEVLVYTNELTYAERMKVREYLSAKWFYTGANAAYVREANRAATVDVDQTALDVASGAGAVGQLAVGSGTFTKKGAGELLLEDCVQPDGTVSVAAGTLYFKSLSLTRDSLPFSGKIHLHVDACDTNSITFKEIAGKGTCVERMKTVRGADMSFAAAAQCKTNSPLHKLVPAESAGRLKPGMPVVDMGPFVRETRSGKYGEMVLDGSAQYMWFSSTGSATLRTVFLVMGSAQGGGQPIGWSGRYDNYWTGGWLRTTDLEKLGNYATPLTCYRQPESFVFADRTMLRLNGVDINRAKDGFSGGYDIVTATTFIDAIKGNAFACSHYQNNLGGLELGEAILSKQWHSPEEVKWVEAYLKKKWFTDGETVGYRKAQIGTLNVAAGATVDSIGDAPVTVGALSGAGTVVCAVAFADAAVFEVEVLADGTVAGALTVPATLDLSKGGTIRLTGYTARLKKGLHRVVATATAPAGAWTVAGYAGNRAVASATADDGLYLAVKSRGFATILR